MPSTTDLDHVSMEMIMLGRNSGSLACWDGIRNRAWRRSAKPCRRDNCWMEMHISLKESVYQRTHRKEPRDGSPWEPRQPNLNMGLTSSAALRYHASMWACQTPDAFAIRRCWCRAWCCVIVGGRSQRSSAECEEACLPESVWPCTGLCYL